MSRTVLLIAPVTLAVTRELQIAPFPFLIAEVLASNIGGTATLVGDPPNIMIGSQAGLSFNSFLFHLAPIVVVVQAVQAMMLHLIWGRATHATVENRLRVMTLDARAAIVDLPLLLQSMAVLAVVIVALVFEDRLQLEPATIAMGGAAVLMLLDNWEHRGAKQTVNVTRTLTEVEWITIFFFVGLFIVVHAVEVSGLLQLLAGKLVAVTGNNLALGGVIILWLSAFLAAIIDNIPVRRGDDPGHQGHGAGLWRAGAYRAVVVVPVAWRLPRRQRHADRRHREPHRRRHRRAQRHRLRLCAIHALCAADDDRFDPHLSALRLAAVFLTASRGAKFRISLPYKQNQAPRRGSAT